MYDMKPESAAFRKWAEDWLTEKGYKVHDRTPWKRNMPTVVYALDKTGRPVFGILLHLFHQDQMPKRIVRLMDHEPRPGAIYVFVPRNAPFEVHFVLEGAHTYGFQTVEGPDYHYDSKVYGGKPWESVFELGVASWES